MMSAEYNPRVDILMDTIEKNFNTIAQGLGWTISRSAAHNDNSYAEVTVSRDAVSHRFGYLYSQSTAQAVYRQLELTAEAVFVQGMGFDPSNSFSRDCKIPVLPDSDFLYVMTDWNMEFLGVEPSQEGSVKEERETLRIIEEDPIQQIYAHLQSLTSRTVANQAVMYHAGRDGLTFTDDVVSAKAKGVSYLVQNAIDYYDNAATRNMTQRLLNLYYGTIALMEAEMLISGEQYSMLSEIEQITKSGHGMTTFGDAGSLKDFNIGVLDKGLFQAWLSHRGIDVSGFPDSRRRAETSELQISLDELLQHIPELQNIMQGTEPDYRPYFLFPDYDMQFNHTRSFSDPVYDRKYVGSYVSFLNLEGKHDPDWERQLIESFLAPITIVGEYRDKVSGSEGWRTFVKHRKDGHHYESYQTHKGQSASMIIAPLFGRTSDWEVFAVMILYALSIIVRYMPNLWTRILHGDLDRYKAVIYQFSRVAERELTQIFLEKLTGKKVVISHPQRLL